MILLFLCIVTIGTFDVTAGNYGPDYSYLVTCSEDSYGYVTISWEGPTGPDIVQYTVTISGGLVETHYTHSNSIKTKSPLPLGQMISIVVGRILKDTYEGDGLYVEHARGSYIHGSSASGPCPKKIGSATASFYRYETETGNGQWEWMVSVTHVNDFDMNNDHRTFRVFVFSDTLDGNVVGSGYCSGGGSETIRGSDGRRKLYVKLVAVDCIGDSPHFEGHYLYGEMDLLNTTEGSVSLIEVNR